MNVLVVDGPLRGRIYHLTEGTSFLHNDYMPLLTKPDEPIKVLTYHVHRYVLINRVIKLASLCLLTEEISPEDVWEAIASDNAKNAVAQVVPDPR